MKQANHVVYPFTQQQHQQQQQQKSPFKTPTKIIESQQQQHKSPLLNLTKNFAHAHNNHNPSPSASTINKSGILQTLNNSKNLQHESPSSFNFKQSSPQRLASPQASLSQHWSNNNNNNNNNNNTSSIQRQISIQNILEG
jgi:hypothetical protein